jgi:hypothetical protein
MLRSRSAWLTRGTARFYTAVLVLTLWGVAGCFGPNGVKVENPAPIAAGASLEATEQAILDSLPKKGWTTETVEAGRIVAFLPIRKHLLRVEIRYDPQQVQIAYLDSANLAEERKGDEVYAHKKVNGWMRALATELQQGVVASTSYAPTSGGVAEPPPEPAGDAAGAADGTVPAGSGQVPAPNE